MNCLSQQQPDLKVQTWSWSCCVVSGSVQIGFSSGVSRMSQFRSFSFSAIDKIKRFFGLDDLLTGFVVAECVSLLSFSCEGCWEPADVLQLPSEFWESKNLFSWSKVCPFTQCLYTATWELHEDLAHEMWKSINTNKIHSIEHTVRFSVAVISSKSESTSGTVSGPALSEDQLLWKCLTKNRGNAAKTKGKERKTSLKHWKSDWDP